MRELELKEQSVKLRQALQKVVADDEGNTAEAEEVECINSPVLLLGLPDTNLHHNQSKWIQLLGTGLVVEPHHLHDAEQGDEFACVHNRDSAADFMNQEKLL